MRGLFRGRSRRCEPECAAAQRGDRLAIDAAGVVGAVAEQHHRADGQVRRFPSASCFRLSPMRVAARSACSSFRSSMRVELAVEAVEARLKLLLDSRRARRSEAPRPPAPGASTPSSAMRHAARIVHQHGDDVLLRLQLRDRDRRLPQQHSTSAASIDCSTQIAPRAPAPRSESPRRQPRADQPARAPRRPPRSTATAPTPARRRAGRSGPCENARADT